MRDVERGFGFFDGMISRSRAMNFSVDKSCGLGWDDFIDLAECIFGDV